uniref:Uncharacterized protein n=1 Tax=Arion vulgaris TaxID=1028688 RepID=A0A0B7BXX2_9EUPU
MKQNFRLGKRFTTLKNPEENITKRAFSGKFNESNERIVYKYMEICTPICRRAGLSCER